MDKINLEIKKIIEDYLKYANISIYKIEKNKIVTGKTINNILKNSNSKISKTTIQKLTKLPDLKNEDYKKLEIILKNLKINKVYKKDSKINEELLIKLIDKVIEKNILKKLDDTNAESYFEKRKITSFDSNVGSRTLLAKKIWELNDIVFEKWGDIKMLLDITPTKDKKEMKKGLLSVATNLREMADNLEKEAFSSNDLATDTIIDI